MKRIQSISTVVDGRFKCNSQNALTNLQNDRLFFFSLHPLNHVLLCGNNTDTQKKRAVVQRMGTSILIRVLRQIFRHSRRVFCFVTVTFVSIFAKIKDSFIVNYTFVTKKKKNNSADKTRCRRKCTPKKFWQF